MYNSYGACLFTAETAPPRISEYAEQKRTEQSLVYASVNLKQKYG